VLKNAPPIAHANRLSLCEAQLLRRKLRAQITLCHTVSPIDFISRKPSNPADKCKPKNNPTETFFTAGRFLFLRPGVFFRSGSFFALSLPFFALSLYANQSSVLQHAHSTPRSGRTAHSATIC
jgi:hypothetical protein